MSEFFGVNTKKLPEVHFKMHLIFVSLFIFKVSTAIPPVLVLWQAMDTR